MGITGLLPFVKKSCRPSKIDEFYGQTVAVDACCWLHKGAFGCAEKLVKNEETDFYVHYCLKYVKMLLSYKIHVILVFDGASLPAKKKTDAERKERRLSMKTKGKRLLAEGNINEANDCFRKCTEITCEMVRNLMKACNSLPDVDCIVAPYESDAQLAYFSKEGIAQLIITEDSDLIVFGCSNIMFKMDLHGHGCLYEKKILPLSLGSPTESFDFVKFRRACILSGCDYIDGLDGIGLVKANKFFKKTSNDDLRKILRKISSYLRMPKIVVDDIFIEKFIEAENTFLYQIVFDVISRQMTQLNSCSNESHKNMPYAGTILKDSLAYQVALGNVDPYSHKQINNFDPAAKPPCSRSIWNSNYNPAQSAFERPVDSDTSRKQSCQTSAFLTTASRFVIKHCPKSPKLLKKPCESKLLITQCEGYSSQEELKPSPQTTFVPKAHVVSRHFVNPFAIHKDKGLESNANSEQEKSALELLESEDEGARLSDSFLKSPLSLFQSPCCLSNNKSNISQSESEATDSGTISSPVFSRNKKRIFVASPSSSSNVEKTGRNLRKFCYVSPKKLFDSTASEKDDKKEIFTGYSSTELPDTGSSLVSSSSSTSSTDSGLGKCNYSCESLVDNLIDLTGEDDNVEDGYSSRSLTPISQLKYLHKCKPLGLGKPPGIGIKKNSSGLKQANIKEMFSSFAYKKS